MITVVTITTCRKSLLKAASSVYSQDFDGPIQYLIGVDVEKFNRFSNIYLDLERSKPANVELSFINMGYSTSKRHGGVHSSGYGGSLKTAASFLAKYPLIAYLDDDDWWEPNHLSSLAKAIRGNPWAFALCNYVDPDTLEILGPDNYESMGPGKGLFAGSFGGFVRPSAMMVDKTRVAPELHLWSESFLPDGSGDDRKINKALIQKYSCGATNLRTVNYVIDPKDSMHQFRMDILKIKKEMVKVESVR